MASQIGFEPTAFRLGGEPSIQLRYWDLRKIMSRPVAEPLPLRRRLLYPAELRKHIQFTYFLRILYHEAKCLLATAFCKAVNNTAVSARGRRMPFIVCIIPHSKENFKSYLQNNTYKKVPYPHI